MRDIFKKTVKYGSNTLSALTLAGFGYVAHDALNSDLSTNTAPPAPPDVSEQFQRNRIGTPEITPKAPAAQPITINLDNGFGLYFADTRALFANESFANSPLYNARYDNHDSKSADLHTGLLALSQITPLSYQAFEAAVWKETRFKPNQINPSGAKGYFQMKPDSFYEGLYRARDAFPPIADVTALVERTRTKIEGTDNYLLKYVAVDDAARARLDDLVQDPLISGLSYYSYIKHYMENFVQAKIPELTAPNQTDLYLISFRGPAGASEFLQNLRNTPDSPAYDMYDGGAAHPAVEQNKSIYYNAETDSYRSYSEVYDYIADNMHIGRAPITGSAAASKDADLINIGSARGNIIPNNALIFAQDIPRPQKRPAPIVTPPLFNDL